MIKDINLNRIAFFSSEREEVYELHRTGEVSDDVVQKIDAFEEESARNLTKDEAKEYRKSGKGYYAHLKVLESLYGADIQECKEYIRLLIVELFGLQVHGQMSTQHMDVMRELTHDAGLATKVYEELTEEQKKYIKEDIGEVRKLASEETLSVEIGYEDTLNSILYAVEKCMTYFWVPTTRPVQRIEEIERAGEMFGGVPWVSASYPWPYYYEGDGKLPYSPGVQIDLKNASKLSGVQFEDGLLQVWFCSESGLGEDQLVRVVPRSVLNTEEPMVIVPDYGNQYLSPLLFDAASDVIGQQITGWFLGGVDLGKNYFNQELLFCEFDNSDDFDERLVGALESLGFDITDCVDRAQEFPGHLFGGAYPVHADYYDDWVKQNMFNLIMLPIDETFSLSQGCVAYSLNEQGTVEDYYFRYT